mgnify:CR=1 FL=1
MSRGRSEDCSVEDETEDGRGAGIDGKGKLGTPKDNGARANGSKGSQSGSRSQPNGNNYQSAPLKKGLFGAA